MNDEVLVSAKGVTRTFTSGNVNVPALRGVNFTLRKGEFVALVGPSGSGKSTFMHLVGALDVQTSGELLVLGRDLAALSKGERSLLRLMHLGFVFQAYNLIPVLTARENVEFVLELQGISPNQRTEMAMSILKELGLEALANRRPKELSGGEQQRVAVARAVVSTPKIVLADEPTANLDGTNAETLLNVMHHLREEHGVTFLFSTHDPRVMRHAERIVTLTDGLVSDDRQSSSSHKVNS